MTSEDGPWLDMSAYPDVDPDSVLSTAAQSELHDALVAAAPLPDDTWQRLLAIALNDVDETTPAPAFAEEFVGDRAIDFHQEHFLEGLEGLDDDLELHSDPDTHDQLFVDPTPTAESDIL